MCETYAGTLIDQLFNIIIEFPESEPAVLDLRVCLEKTDLRPHLVSSLRHAFESRLLHPGKQIHLGNDIMAKFCYCLFILISLEVRH